MFAQLGVSVEQVDSSELGRAAEVLGEAFAEDPLLRWVMPDAGPAELKAFFQFFLRRTNPRGRELFVSGDGAAVAVVKIVRVSEQVQGEAGQAWAPGGRNSRVADYFCWLEGHRPQVDHHFLEFIGISPARHSKGLGALLLGQLLEKAGDQGLPLWCYSSNPRNLTFYYRHGFRSLGELRRDSETPEVTSLLWEPDGSGTAGVSP